MAQAVRRWKVRVMLGGRDRGLDGIGMKGGRAADRASHRERAAGRERRLGAFAAGIGPRRAFALPALGSLALVLALVGAGGGGRMSGGADERGHLRQAEAPRGGPQPVRAQANPPALPFWQSGGAMNCAETVGKVVWLCEGPRLKALDLSDRTQPRVLGQTEVLPGVLGGLVLEEGHQRAWVLAGPMAVQVDISDPARPRELVRVGVGDSTPYVYASVRPMALAGGRLWLTTADRESVLALDTADPLRPGALESHDFLEGASGQVVALLGRADQLYVLSYRQLMPSPDSAVNDLLSFRVGRDAVPAVLQRLRLETTSPSGSGSLHWDDTNLWAGLANDRWWAWQADGPTLEALHRGRALGCHWPIGMTIRRQRLYATCATGFADNLAPRVIDLSRPPDYPVLATGPGGPGDPGLYSPAVALTGDTFWFSNQAGEWRGLDLGLEGSVPSLAPVGLYTGLGTVAYLNWDGARSRLVASGSDHARAIQMDDAAGPTAGPYLLTGFHVGPAAIDGNRMVLVNVGDGDVLRFVTEARDLSAPPGSPSDQPMTFDQAPLDRRPALQPTRRRPRGPDQHPRPSSPAAAPRLA